MYMFIYGTLMDNSHLSIAIELRARSQPLGKATVQGRLYDLGDYPGLIEEHNTAHRVHGQLIKITDSSIIADLDDYEGVPDLYQRILMDCKTKKGVIAAWVYVYQRNVREQQWVKSGKYIKT